MSWGQANARGPKQTVPSAGAQGMGAGLRSWAAVQDEEEQGRDKEQ